MKRHINLRIPPIALPASHSLAMPARLAFNTLVVTLWLWLYHPVFDYLGIIFTREDFRTNQIVLILIAGLIVFQLRSQRVQLRLDSPPQFSLPALALALGGSILFLLTERFLDINTLSASLFGLASYGLLGLWMRPRAWREGLPAALLVVGVLPFGDHMQTFVGYPMRIATATMVRDGLNALGIPSIGVDTILVLENGVSQVDLPCSGVKSLWTGALFLLAATWVERRAISWRWLGIALVFAVALFVVNLARVGTLVVVGQVLGSRLAAELVHVPLGVLGFVAACALGLLLLNRLPGTAMLVTPEHPGAARPIWLAPVLAFALVALTWAYTPPPVTALSESPQGWAWPSELAVTPMPLGPYELQWFERDAAEAAERYRFAWGNLTGSMILITSTTWRAHHRPERCFEVYGLAVDDSRAVLIAPDFPVRLVALSNRASEHWSASYWFQSDTRVTDDYGTRIADDLSFQHNRWVLVSLLFDQAPDLDTAEVSSFYLALRGTIAERLSANLR